MNEEEDQFFVEPEIEEVHDIKIIEDPNPITDKPPEEPKHIPLKYPLPHSGWSKYPSLRKITTTVPSISKYDPSHSA